MKIGPSATSRASATLAISDHAEAERRGQGADDVDQRAEIQGRGVDTLAPRAAIFSPS